MDGTFGFTKRLKGFEIGDLKPIKGSEKLRAAVAGYGTGQHPWLYLHGPRGTGKTMGAAILVNQARAQGIEAIFVVVPELLAWLKGAFDPAHGRDYDSDWEYIKTAEMLALDDLGTESPTPWAQERLYELCNWRYRHELPTIWTSNLEPDKLGDERIASRVMDVLLCRVVRSGPIDVRRLAR